MLGIEMAGAAGGDLHGGQPMRADACGVVLGFEIALDDGHAQFVLQRVGRRFEKGGLAGPRRRHEVEDEKVARIEMGTIALGGTIVVRQEVLAQNDEVLSAVRTGALARVNGMRAACLTHGCLRK